MVSKRSYGQYCGLARALDVVSGRWSLLIVRELLEGPARYGRLQAGLPGISTNLLSDRLRELEESGVIRRELDAASNSVSYALTPWGQELREPIAALVTWSTPLMVPGPGDDVFQSHWLVVALESLMRAKRSEEPVAVGVEVDGTAFTVRLDESGIHVDRAEGSDTVFRAEAQVVMGLATGLLPIDLALTLGELRGDKADLAAVFG